MSRFIQYTSRSTNKSYKKFILSSICLLPLAMISTPAYADLTNTATVTGTPDAGTLTPATATESVDIYEPIEAEPESFSTINGAVGGVTTSVLGSDILNGVAVDPADVTLTVGASDPELTLDPNTGLITVAPGTPAGTYTVEYTVCEDLNPINCATVTETVTVIVPIVLPALSPLVPGTCGGVLAEAYLLDGLGIGGEQNYRLASGSPTHDPDVFFGEFGSELAYKKNADGTLDYFFDAEPPVQSLNSDVDNVSFSNIAFITGNADDQTDAAEFWRVAVRIDGVPGDSYTFNADNGGAHEFIHYWAEDSSGTVLDSSLGNPNTANGWIYGANPAASTSSTGGATSIVGQTTVPFSFTIPASSTDGIVYLRAMVLDPQVGWGRLSFAGVPECPLPSLSITKVADDTTDRKVGETITYTYTATNDGNVSIEDVTVSDVHNGSGTLSAVTLDTLTNTSGNSADDSADNDIDVLAPDDSVTFEATYIVTEADVIAGNDITNTATVSGEPVVGSLPLTPITADESVSVAANDADLSITKTNTPGVNSEVDQVGDTLTSGTTTTYTLVVTNNGPDTATGAVVTDVVGAGLTCPGTNVVTLSGDGVPSGSFTIADLTGAGITLDTLTDGQSTTLTYACEVN